MKKKGLILVILVIAAVAAAAIFSACDDVEELLYGEPENIKYDGAYITWDKIDGANYYMVSINGAEAQRSNSTTYAYTSTETFEVTITAVYDESEASSSETFKPLASIQTLYISDDGTVSWDAVAGANAYEVSVNGRAETVTDTVYDKFTPGSSCRIKVKPIVSGDNTFYSSYSSESNVYIYAAPSNIKYDGSLITWMGNSSQYAVTINGSTTTVSGNSYTYASKNMDFTVSIKALGNHTSTFDSAEAEEEFNYLDPITNLIVEDGIVKWQSVENAKSYKVMVDGVLCATVEAVQYDALSAGASHDICVMPVNEEGNYFSTWSAIKTVYIIPSPNVSWENELDGQNNNNFIWDAVNVAGGYTVRLTFNGNIVDTYTYSDMQRSFAYGYEQVGEYTVEVKANAPSGSADYYDSRYSTPITVRRLAAPEAAASNFIVSDRDSLSAGFTVNYLQVAGAVGYQLYKDGVLLEGKYSAGSSISDNNVADETVIAQQEFTYMLRSMGGMSTTGGRTVVTLPCLESTALTFNITVQAVPQNLNMSGTVLAWDAVSGNNGYSVAYSGGVNIAQTENYDLSTLHAGTYSVSVCTRGNGSNVLASNASSPVTVTRLSAPGNISITSAGNGTLSYTPVTYASGYSAYLDLSQTALDTNSYDDMYRYISTEGTTVSMVADANYYNVDRTIYYMSSEISPTYQFIRLAAPTFPEGAFANSIELVWNSPSNINTEEYTPTYSVYSAIDEAIGGSGQNSTRFNIENLEGGRSYTFYVKAIGNNTKYLDSDYSEAISIYKLATPQLTIENNMYTWSGVTNAASYILTIDGSIVSDEYHVSGNTYSYTPKYTTVGDHIVTLRAVGDGRATINSSACRYTQRAELLDTPVIDYAYSSEAYVTNGSITVSVTSPVDNCVNYQYEIAGETITSSSLSYTKTILNTGKYTVRAKALGGEIDENGVYYMDSMYADCAKGSDITLLGAPAANSFRINSDGVIQWGMVSSSSGYDYQISFNGGTFEDIVHTQYNSLSSIDGYKQYQSITIRVRASGNASGSVISSAWTLWTWTNAA